MRSPPKYTGAGQIESHFDGRNKDIDGSRMIMFLLAAFLVLGAFT